MPFFSKKTGFPSAHQKDDMERILDSYPYFKKNVGTWVRERQVSLTTWTILQKDGPNHHELRYNVLIAHQMTLITSGCVPFRERLPFVAIPLSFCQRLMPCAGGAAGRAPGQMA